MSTGVPADDRNLALRAARLLAQRAGYEGGVHLDIVKHVPVAGGMGGGSADAAAALVACDALWGTDLGRRGAAPARVAARRRRAVRADGRHGDRHRARRSAEPRPGEGPLRLGRGARRGEGLSTPEVYAHLDALRAPSWRRRHRAAAPRAPAVDLGVLQALRAGDPPRSRSTCATTSRRPRCRCGRRSADALELGEQSGALAGMVSGSGPTLAFLTGDPEPALELQVTLAAAGLNALHVHGPVPGAPGSS